MLEPWLGAGLHANHGERVVVGQRVMQAASDLFLGWTRFRDRHFYVRQLRDMKGSADVATMGVATLADYASACGTTPAGAIGTVRSNDADRSDPGFSCPTLIHGAAASSGERPKAHPSR